MDMSSLGTYAVAVPVGEDVNGVQLSMLGRL